MNDAELRALVRDAVQRHLGAGVPPSEAHEAGAGTDTIHAAGSIVAPHASHDIYITLVNVGSECVIEPNVGCDHCGYCKSHGH